MTVAIYARKSTSQSDVADESKSVARQIASARAFAARTGLPPIDDLHVFVDDAVSGADVRNLRARARLIAAVEAGRVQAVIMADMSRFSRREGHEVVAELKQMARKAAIYFFETGQRFVFGDIGTNIANFAVAEANADYRRKVRTKTLAAMRFKAERGHVVGGRAFGYQHHDVLSGATDASGRPIRSHVTRSVYEPEAAIVREIFERYAAGQGFKKIADALNRKGAVTPRPRPGRRASWATSSVRAILLQPLYRGLARWNRLQQHDEDGNPTFVKNAEEAHVTFFDPNWRIVPDALAEAVAARFADESRQKFRSRPGAKAKYLLSGGMLLCPSCGGRFEGLNGQYYVCATRRHAGKSICNNRLAIKIDAMDTAVLRLLDAQVLHPAFVEQVLTLACGNRNDDGRADLEAQRDELSKAVANLAKAVALAPDIPEILAELRQRTAARDALDRRLAALAEPIDRARLRSALEQRAKDWKKMLRSDYPDEARFVVQQLVGPLTLWSGTAEDGAAFFEDPDPDYPSSEGKPAFADCGFKAIVTAEGLLGGLGAFNMVAGGGFEPPTFGL